MKLKVEFVVEVEGLTNDGSLDGIPQDQIAPSVVEAMENILAYAEGEGHCHKLANVISILHVHDSITAKPV